MWLWTKPATMKLTAIITFLLTIILLAQCAPTPNVDNTEMILRRVKRRRYGYGYGYGGGGGGSYPPFGGGGGMYPPFGGGYPPFGGGIYPYSSSNG